MYSEIVVCRNITPYGIYYHRLYINNELPMFKLYKVPTSIKGTFILSRAI